MCYNEINIMFIEIREHVYTSKSEHSSVAYLESNLMKRVAAPGMCTFPCEKTKYVTVVVVYHNFYKRTCSFVIHMTETHKLT